MQNTTPLLNSSRRATFGCYAAIPGSVPVGKICAQCALMETDRGKNYCKGYQHITRHRGSAIDSATAACRYFEVHDYLTKRA
jgi:hypothetical protein